jgi:hypothetical protein
MRNIGCWWAFAGLSGLVLCVVGCNGAAGNARKELPQLRPLQEEEPLRLRIRGTDERGRRVNEVFINGRWVAILNDPLFDQWLTYQVARYEAFYQQTGTPKAMIQERNGCRQVFRAPVILEVVGDGHAMGAVHAVTRKLREAGFAMPPQIVSATETVPAN